MSINKYYSIGKGDFDIKDLRERHVHSHMPLFIMRDGSSSGGDAMYKTTELEDYDKEFVYKMKSLKPVDGNFKMLDYHLKWFMDQLNSSANEFIRHMKFDIKPKLKKAGRDDLVELIEDWIKEKEA